MSLSPFSFQALKLKRGLEALAGVTGKVLDVGCGGGGMAKAIKRYRPDLEIFGVDIDERSINLAKAEPEGVNFRVGNAYELDFPKETFDAVLMFDVLEHLKANRVLEEIERVLKPGGVFHAYVPLENQPFTIYRILFGKLGWRVKERQVGHIERHDWKGLKARLEKHHLEVKGYRFSNHLLSQTVDLTYHGFWDFIKKNPGISVETYLAKNPEGILRLPVTLVKCILFPTIYLESWVLRRVPGGGVSVTAVKKSRNT